MESITPYFYKLSQKLPEPYTVTYDQIRSYYQNLYSKLLDSFNHDDFCKIDKLLDTSNYKLAIPKIKLSKKNDDPLLVDLAQLLFKIITIYPVKYYKVQYMAANYLNKYLSKNKHIDGLTFEWYPYYKVMNYYIKNKSFYIYNKIHKTIVGTFYSLLKDIVVYFPDEVETEIDGITVKTNTTEQLFKKFFQTDKKYKFESFIPPSKGLYKTYLHYIISSLNEGNNTATNLLLVLKAIQTNVEDDFSFILPVITNLIVGEIFDKSRLNSNGFSKLVCQIISMLFISPSTRSRILELFDKIFPSLKSLSHPSSPSSSHLIRQFAQLIVFYVFNYTRVVSKDKPYKKAFNLKKELRPSQEEIHRLFTITSEINIMNISVIEDNSQVLLETRMDPSLIDRYFEIASSCIDLVDASSVANGCWRIIVGLICSIEKSETLLNNFDALFRLAVENLHNAILQPIISKFIVYSFIKVPFNKEKTIPSLEYVNFAELAHLYYTKLIEVLKALQSDENGIVINKWFQDSMLLSSICLFRFCDDSVKSELLPLFTSLASNESIAICYVVIEAVILNYCIYASPEQSQKVVKAFRRQIDFEHHSLTMLRYLLTVYSTITTVSTNTVESTKQVTDLLLKYTNSENEKIRKAAWFAIMKAFSISDRMLISTSSFKKDVEKENIFEYSSIKDFEIDSHFYLDLTDLIYEVFDPVYDKLLTLKDPKEIITLLNEAGSNISYKLNEFYECPEGSIDEINEIYQGPINIVPQLIKKSFPIKEKFLKFIIRLIKDFPDNESIFEKVISYVPKVGLKYSNYLYLINDHYNSFYQPKIQCNLPVLDYMMICTLYQRKQFLVPPLTDSMKELISIVADLALNKSLKIQNFSICFLKYMTSFYDSYVNQVIFDKIINKDNTSCYKEYVICLSRISDLSIFVYNDEILCKILIFLLQNFHLNDEKTIINAKGTIISLCSQSIPFGTNKRNKQEYIDLLKEIEDKYMYKYPVNKVYNQIIIDIIILCMQQIDEISDKVLEYVIKNITHYDQHNSISATILFNRIVKRRIKFQKEKIIIDKLPTIADFPNILDQVSIQLPSNGLYFPYSLHVENEEEEEAKEEEDNNKNEDGYSIESEPTDSLDINIKNAEVNEDIKKVFDTFKKIKIIWDYDELYDSDIFSSAKIESSFKPDYYYLKKYEFVCDDLLIKNIKNFFASATHSLNEKNQKNGINYSKIWKNYSFLVGPHCISKLSKICNKYLSHYYESIPNITTKILVDLIKGFMEGIPFWPVEDRISFFQLVALPTIFVISTNPKTSSLVYSIFFSSKSLSNVYCFAPLFKAFFTIAPKGANLPVYSRTLASLVCKQVAIRPYLFFNAIDQFHDQYIVHFVDHMSEYNSNEVENIVNIYFFIIMCACHRKSSSFYSEKVEEKKQFVIDLLDNILGKKVTDEIMKKNLTKFTSRLLFYFYNSCSSIRLFLSKIFIRHLHSFFEMLSSLVSRDEKVLFSQFSSFIVSDVFFFNTELELVFVSSLVKELMNSSLPMQLLLLEDVNVMLENNVISIPADDYMKYEELFLNYNRRAIQNNFGKDVRMKLAKILGIFEIRRCTFDPERGDVDECVMKAGSILLNSFLFDRADPIVRKSLDFLEETCSGRDSNSRDFYESVSEVFIHRHSNHVINEAAEIVMQYNGKLMPSYIC